MVETNAKQTQIYANKEAKQQNEIKVSPKYPMDKTRIIKNFLYYVTPRKRTDTFPLNGMGSWLSSNTSASKFLSQWCRISKMCRTQRELNKKKENKSNQR